MFIHAKPRFRFWSKSLVELLNRVKKTIQFESYAPSCPPGRVRLYSPMRMKKQAVDTLDDSVELFKAFADPVRLRLLSLLSDGEVCVCHLHTALELPQSTVSRHLAYLRKRRLVIGRKEGLWVYYRLAKPGNELHTALIDRLEIACGSATAKSDKSKLDRGGSCGG